MYKLLIVDDEYIECDALEFLIQESNLKISFIKKVFNGFDAVREAIMFEPDIIFMDLKMPGMDGIEASKTIKQHLPKVKIIFLTAFDYFEYAREGISIGIEEYLVKPISDENLFQVLEKVINSLEKEKSNWLKQIETEKKFQHMTKYLEKEIISSLIVSDLEQDQINEYFDFINIDFVKGITTVIKIDFDDEITINQRTMIKNRYLDKLKRRIRHYGYNLLMSCISERVYVLVIGTDIDKDKVLESNEIICRELNIRTYQGVSSVVDTPMNISKAFLEAKIGGMMRENEHVDSQYALYHQLQENLYEVVINLDRKNIETAVDEMMVYLYQYTISLEQVHQKVYDLLMTISNLINKEYRTEFDTSCYNRIKFMEFPFELKIFIMKQIDFLLHCVENKNKDRTSVLVDDICSYINEHYFEDITLDNAANKVGYSTFYFSKIFKRYRGVTFCDYVAKVRINKAKEFLSDPQLKIKEIGEEVGYEDPNYFTRVFKRIEGTTPTQYRSKIMKS